MPISIAAYSKSNGFQLIEYKILQSIAEAEEDMKQTSSLFLERDVCEEESMSAFSEATATIVAQVFTKAFVKVSRNI